MNQSEFNNQILKSIMEAQAKKENMNFANFTTNDLMTEIAKSIQENSKKIILSNSHSFGTDLVTMLQTQVKEKYEEAEQNELNYLEQLFNKNGTTICNLFKLLDEFVLNNNVDSNWIEINKILEILFEETKERDEIRKFITEYKQKK